MPASALRAGGGRLYSGAASRLERRWTPESQTARPKFACFPFGGGPWMCIGAPFAWMEGVVVLAAPAQH